MGRDSVLIYRSWLKGVQRLSLERQNGLIRLAIDYGLDGTTPSDEDLDPLAEMFLQMVMPQIDANNRKYLNGLNGGAPKGNCNNPCGRGGKRTNQKPTKNQPKINQQTTKNQRNVYDNVNDNVNADIKKENKTKKKIQPMTEDELAFYNGMKDKYPRVMGMKEPLSLKQYQSIKLEYDVESIKNKLEEMENWESLSKKHSANLTLRNWLKKEQR